MEPLFIIFSFIIGACLGSFFCCQARRLHLATPSVSDHSVPISTRARSAKPNSRPSASSRRPSPYLPPRSVCLSCHYQLKWYDNIPIISWLLLRGECRHCHQSIGAAELFSELSTALAAALLTIAFLSGRLGSSYSSLLLGIESQPVFGPLGTETALSWAIFAAAFLLAMALCFLAIHDGLYGTLPVFALTISLVCAIILVILRSWSYFSTSGFILDPLIQPLLGAILLGGVYLALYFVSHGRWIGDGDWILGAIIGLALGGPWLAIITLFLANFLATIIMLPSAIHHHTHVIHLGPFLVAGFICTIVMSCAIMGI